VLRWSYNTTEQQGSTGQVGYSVKYLRMRYVSYS
jgi:hypothetical protein